MQLPVFDLYKHPKICPRCGEQGSVRNEAIAHGVRLIVLSCPECLHMWTVYINADGTRRYDEWGKTKGEGE